MNTPKGPIGLQRLLPALRYSLQGLKAAWLQEAAFRQELLLLAILLPLALWLADDGIERVLLIGSILLILIVELINSSVETAIDRISAKHHPLSKQAKDLGSAAVFMTLLLALFTWLLILTAKFC
jgi:diacylglycerol kinase (ATP)